MHILALNCGSSSLKSASIDSESSRRVQSIRIENVGAPGCAMHVGDAVRALPDSTDLRDAVKILLDAWRKPGKAVPNPQAVVHRIVHGGERYTGPVLIDDEVLAQLDELSQLAPLHNPPALSAVRLARTAYPDIPHIATFDTAFHATLPRQAREYALPAPVRARFGIRRYGFHGLSHAHVMVAVSDYLQRAPQELRIISCHLGNGASVAAIEHGSSVETSMGMTPLEGLVMGTRAGDLDPGVILQLLRVGDMSSSDIDVMLNQHSGLQGLTGTNDMREIERRAAEADDDCQQALLVYAHRVRKYIGAYVAIMGGVDAIAFTGGVGENSAATRHRCMQRLEFLGALLDADRNRDLQGHDLQPCAEISATGSPVKLLVVRADEELAMARAAAQLLT